MAFYINFQMICIFLEISKAFYLLIYLQILVFKSFIIPKLICGCKLLEIKNRNNFIKTDLLLLATNSTIIIL